MIARNRKGERERERRSGRRVTGYTGGKKRSELEVADRGKMTGPREGEWLFSEVH